MRRIALLLSLSAMLFVLAIPVAFAQDRDDRQEDRQERFEDSSDEGFFFFDEDDSDEDGSDEDGSDEDDFDFDEDEDGNEGEDGTDQEFDQEAESGDVDQSFNVSGKGDNSNQCVGINGIANTGNAQNQVGVLERGDSGGGNNGGGEDDEFEFEDIESEVTIDGTAMTTCDQMVNQAAAAFGK